MSKISLNLNEVGPITVSISKNFAVTPYTEFLLKEMNAKNIANKTICDFGCGSGIISLACLKNNAKKVVAIDIHSEAIELTKKNTARFNSDCISVYNGADDKRLQQELSDLKFDIIFSNPSTLPVKKNKNNKFYSGGIDGLSMVTDLIEFSEHYLSPMGKLVLLVTSLTNCFTLFEKLEQSFNSISLIESIQLPFRQHYKNSFTHWEELKKERLCFYFRSEGKESEIVYKLEVRNDGKKE